MFTLEAGFAPDSGVFNQGGRAFGRQALVGIGGDWGTVTLGRQYTMLFWSILDADILGPNIYGSGSLDSYIPNARADNSIAYRGTFGGLTAGATYSLGRDVANAGPSPAGTNCPGESATDKRACREWSILAKYDTPSWGAALAVDEIRGGPGAFAGLTSSSMKDTRTSLNGYGKFGELKIGAGLVRRDNGASPVTPKSNLWYVGAMYPVSPLFVLDGEVFRLNVKNSANKATLVAVRGTYNLSKRTAVYATVGHISNAGTLALSASSGAAGSNPSAGGSQTAVATGIRHSF
jgi:predicted porin